MEASPPKKQRLDDASSINLNEVESAGTKFEELFSNFISKKWNHDDSRDVCNRYVESYEGLETVDHILYRLKSARDSLADRLVDARTPVEVKIDSKGVTETQLVYVVLEEPSSCVKQELMRRVGLNMERLSSWKLQIQGKDFPEDEFFKKGIGEDFGQIMKRVFDKAEEPHGTRPSKIQATLSKVLT